MLRIEQSGSTLNFATILLANIAQIAIHSTVFHSHFYHLYLIFGDHPCLFYRQKSPIRITRRYSESLCRHISPSLRTWQQFDHAICHFWPWLLPKTSNSRSNTESVQWRKGNSRQKIPARKYRSPLRMRCERFDALNATDQWNKWTVKSGNEQASIPYLSFSLAPLPKPFEFDKIATIQLRWAV